MKDMPPEVRRPKMELAETLAWGWSHLRSAARRTHRSAIGGMSVCICGSPSGGSAACTMLELLAGVIRDYPDGPAMPANIRLLKRIIG